MAITHRWTNSIRLILTHRTSAFASDGERVAVSRVDITNVGSRNATSATALAPDSATLSTVVAGHTVALVAIVVVVVDQIAVERLTVWWWGRWLVGSGRVVTPPTSVVPTVVVMIHRTRCVAIAVMVSTIVHDFFLY